MKHTLALTERAQGHIASAMKWYESERLGRGDRFIGVLSGALAVLTDHSHLGAPAYHGLRCFSLRPFPYTLYYRVVGSIVEVRACIHDRRQPGSRWRRRVREAAAAVDL